MTDRNDPRNIFFNQREQFEHPEQQVSSEAERFAEKAKQQGGDDYATKVEQMKALAKKYERAGEGQLVRDIVNNVIEQKAAGKLSNDQLVTFAKRVSPLLNSEQKQRLNELVEQLLKL